jgi:hypothetical protein
VKAIFLAFDSAIAKEISSNACVCVETSREDSDGAKCLEKQIVFNIQKPQQAGFVNFSACASSFATLANERVSENRF